ncbi:hypothetical protein Tco_0083757 [Tanacetum coccineum]
MENANPSCSTSNMEFIDPKKKKEIESWFEDSRIVDSLDGMGHFLKRQAYIDLESPINVMSKQHYNDIMNKGLDSRQKPSNPSKNSSFVGDIIDHHLGEVVFRKPFARNTGLVYDQEKVMVTFKKDEEKITFKMPHKMEASNCIDFKDINTDSIPPSVLGSNDDYGKSYYSDSLTLGPEYREDESISKEIRHLIENWKDGPKGPTG